MKMVKNTNYKEECGRLKNILIKNNICSMCGKKKCGNMVTYRGEYPFCKCGKLTNNTEVYMVTNTK